MKSNDINTVLVLSDGTIFKGKSCGKIGTTTGEIAFNTGMSGYQEIFTDPSYHGQIITMANAHIGNYGTNKLVFMIQILEQNTFKIAHSIEYS